ncbi:MAG: TIGR04283 family arsenosugar biosynthesis glycosyltransferase [Alphaproteobacteria bacterium]
MRLGVVIPTLNAAERLPDCLAAIGIGKDRIDLDIVVADGGSTDASRRIAAASGARVVQSAPGRGRQLRNGAAAAQGDWLLFVHADTVLSPDWAAAALAAGPEAAGYGRLRFDDASFAARIVAGGGSLRARLFGLPYGDQALLIARPLHDAVGGYPDWPLMEDVGIARRLGRKRLKRLDFTATTAADRYRRDGWLRRSWRNLTCLALFFAGWPPDRIKRRYER